MQDILFYITALAIMQDFRDNEKNDKKWPPFCHFGSYICEICQGLFLCKTLHYVLHSRSSYFALFLNYINITKIIQTQNDH